VYLENAYEFLDLAGEWYDNTATGTVNLVQARVPQLPH
jgi:hypothetical protein